jgi:hypothetical protein
MSFISISLLFLVSNHPSMERGRIARTGLSSFIPLHKERPVVATAGLSSGLFFRLYPHGNNASRLFES